MAHANPWAVGGHQFSVLDHTGTLTATADVTTIGSFTGLLTEYETRIALSAPATTVEIRLVHFSTPATVTAFDGAGALVDTATMSVSGGMPETLQLTGAAIESLIVEAPQNETLLLELCVS
jgi:CBS domain-containing protein